MQFGMLTRYVLDEYDMSRQNVTITCNMSVDQLREFVEYQGFQINDSYSLLNGTCAVSDDVDDLISEFMVRRDSRVPSMYKVLDYYGNQSIKLEVDLVRTGQRGQ